MYTTPITIGTSDPKVGGQHPGFIMDNGQCDSTNDFEIHGTVSIYLVHMDTLLTYLLLSVPSILTLRYYLARFLFKDKVA